MKLRIKGNTIRLRLTKSEVGDFSSSFYVQEQTEFGQSIFSYSLKAVEQDFLSATLENNNLTIFIPKAKAQAWTTTGIVGISGEMEVGEGKKLYLLIEKDFKCLDETIADQSDNYENPLAVKNK